MKKAFLSLFSGSAFGKVIGFVREILLAALFGTGLSIDAYRAAQTAVLVPSNFFTNDTLNAGFIPLYVKYKLSNSEKADSLFNSVYTALLIISVVITAGLIFLSSSWSKFLVPGFDDQTQRLVSEMIIAMAIGLPFYVQSTILSYLEMANGSFTLTSIRASIQSLGLILGTIAAYLLNNVVLLAWGFTFAYILFFIWALVMLKGKKLLDGKLQIVFSKDLKSCVLELFHNIKPLILLSLFVQLNIVIERIIASKIGIGILASLEYAKVISESGLSLMAMPLGLIGLAQFGNLSKEDLAIKVLKLTKVLLIFLIPISTILYLNSTIIIDLLYSRGMFGKESTFVTSEILMGISMGFWAYIIGYFYIKVLNSQFLNIEVMYISLFAIISQIATNFILYPILGAPTLGISLSIYSLILFILTLRKIGIWRYLFTLTLKLLVGIILLLILKSLLNLVNMDLLIFNVVYWILFSLSVKEIRETIMSLR